MRKWTDAALQQVADDTTIDIMEDIASVGRENVDPLEIILVTCDVENIHDEDRDVLLHMMGYDFREAGAQYLRH
jgi:hypothetical protein